jgi:hypothetical protein
MYPFVAESARDLSFTIGEKMTIVSQDVCSEGKPMLTAVRAVGGPWSLTVALVLFLVHMCEFFSFDGFS